MREIRAFCIGTPGVITAVEMVLGLWQLIASLRYFGGDLGGQNNVVAALRIYRLPGLVRGSMGVPGRLAARPTPRRGVPSPWAFADGVLLVPQSRCYIAVDEVQRITTRTHAPQAERIQWFRRPWLGP